MFGIHDSAWISAEGLDIQENDPEAIMLEAEKEAVRTAEGGEGVRYLKRVSYAYSVSADML